MPLDAFQGVSASSPWEGPHLRGERGGSHGLSDRPWLLQLGGFPDSKVLTSVLTSKVTTTNDSGVPTSP